MATKAADLVAVEATASAREALELRRPFLALWGWLFYSWCNYKDPLTPSHEICPPIDAIH